MVTAVPVLWVEPAGLEPERSAASPAGLGPQWKPGLRSSGFSSDLAPDLSSLLSGVVPCVMEHQKDTPRLSHLGVYREDMSLSCMCEDAVCYPCRMRPGGRLASDCVCVCVCVCGHLSLIGVKNEKEPLYPEVKLLALF